MKLNKKNMYTEKSRVGIANVVCVRDTFGNDMNVYHLFGVMSSGVHHIAHTLREEFCWK